MFYKTESCALLGLEPHGVLCEVDLACQLPSLTLVGLPSSVTQESRERVRTAIVNSGFDWPARKVTISLLPANLPKWGSHHELAMALGVLGAAHEQPLPKSILALGELSLSGSLRECGWIASISLWLCDRGRALRASGEEPLLVLAHENDIRKLSEMAPELKHLCELRGVTTLKSAFSVLLEVNSRTLQPILLIDGPASSAMAAAPIVPAASSSPFDLLSRVQQEPLGVVAAVVAIAGGHNALFAGPHGMGKSMLIRAICEALPALSAKDVIERHSILCTFGEHFASNDTVEAKLTQRRTRRPVVPLQASISRSALEGSLLGSGQVLPGEMTRAHLGVLVADEFLEYRRDVIEAFRQPMDDGIVRLQRAKFRTVLPAEFQFLASTNLCPCGYYGLLRRDCRCSAPSRKNYQTKISGPVLDRFDLAVLVGAREGKESEVRLPVVPPDLHSLIESLCDPLRWPERFERAWANAGDTSWPSADAAELWSQVPSCEASNRGRVKLAQVARTIAQLLDEPRGIKHLRLAMVLRQDFDLLMRGQLQFSNAG